LDKVFILIWVDQIVDGLGFNNLIKVTINFMMEGGGLSKEELSKKLLCFAVDGVNMFQGSKTKMTKQIKDSWTPFSMDVHCVAHHINFATQSLGDLTLIAKNEGFMLNMYGYFGHSLTRHLEF
jgi:hypothetical protein